MRNRFTNTLKTLLIAIISVIAMIGVGVTVAPQRANAAEITHNIVTKVDIVDQTGG